MSFLMLIDWLTLRIKLDLDLSVRNLFDRIVACMGMTVCFDANEKKNGAIMYWT